MTQHSTLDTTLAAAGPVFSAGLHHVTAIASDPRRNVEFYSHTLGLRLVKKTVNFDDPGTYHLYYGDETGTPGTILTFFPWPQAAQGRAGVGETTETAFIVPQGAIGFWTARFIEKGIAHEAIEKRFGLTVLPFRDPDGMRLALVGVPGAEAVAGRVADGIPAEHAIRGFHGVTLMVAKPEKTARILTEVFGYQLAGEEGPRQRYASTAAIGGTIDLYAAPGFLRGVAGRGSVHHIAFRAVDDAAEFAMVEKLRVIGQQPTPQQDRNYFRSVYFREPNGVLFEIATDIPGFAVDEPVESLGTALKLPAQYEAHRAAIEAHLPAL